MSNLRVDSIANSGNNGPVDFPTGVSGDGANLSFDPKIISFDPPSLGTNVSTGGNITLTFDQDIKFDESGTIEIRTGSSSGTIIESFAITNGSPASGLSILGTQLTINPTSTLSLNTTYYIIIPSSGIKDLAGTTSFAGTSSYSFETASSSFGMSGGNHEFVQANSGSPTGYYKYHIFTGTTTFTLDSPSVNATDLTMFMVAGGGGGGSGDPSYRAGGGGGAGGLLKRTGPTWSISSGNYTMTIGGGGIGSGHNSASPQFTNTNGGDSAITPPTSPTSYVLRAVGGGAGGYPANASPPYKGNPGGSGGGAYSHATPNQTTQPTLATGGAGTPGQGNPGGGNTFYYPGTAHNQNGGGGGGAGGAGQRAFANGSDAPTSSYWYAGNGGNGLLMSEFPFSDIFSPGIIPESDFPSDSQSRSNGYFAGGGGGGSAPPGNMYRGNGGLGGGGNGAGGSTPTSAPVSDRPGTPGATPTNYGQDGASRTGGGGGAGYNPQPSYWGGNGGSGIAMIRYAYPADLI
jgi:hypothetical protein